MPRVLIPLAQGFEELEAVTLIDLLRRARMEVVVAGLVPGPVTGSRHTVLLPDTTLEAVRNEDFDLIVLPGGLPGATHLEADERLAAMLCGHARQGKTLGAICAAPRVLLVNGLLAGRRATAYPGTLDADTSAQVMLSDEAVVVDGPIVTSRGPGTAMDFALTLIGLMLGPAAREAVERPLQRPVETP
ncbi:MAG: DJ-1/PfpI family protein [Magnetococcus sp. WYHC-3]